MKDLWEYYKKQRVDFPWHDNSFVGIELFQGGAVGISSSDNLDGRCEFGQLEELAEGARIH